MDISIMFEESSLLVEEYQSTDNNLKKNLIRQYLEKCINIKSNLISDFKQGLDWININKPLSFSQELKGKVVVLDFFTFCCINCIHILPQLKKLEHKFSIEDGLVVIGVHSPKFPNEHSTGNVAAAVQRYEISHPVVNDHEEVLWTAMSICCWPTLAVIGPDGQVLLLLMGETHERLLNSFVEEALSIFHERKTISGHSIDGIGVDNQFKDSGPLRFPGKVCAIESSSGRLIAIADTGHNRIVVVDGDGYVQYTVGGLDSGFHDGSLDEAKFHAPQGLVFTDSSTLYVADTENHAIRKVDLSSGRVTTVVGDGCQGEDHVGGGRGGAQRLSSPWDITALSSAVLLIAMAGMHQLWAYFTSHTTFWRKKQYEEGTCAAVAGSGREENRNNAYPQSAGFAQPSGLTVASQGDRQTVYVADSESSTVRAVSAADGRVSAVVGGRPDPQDLFGFGDSDGRGVSAQLQHPLGVAWSEAAGALFVCDSYNHKLRRVEPETRDCTTVTHTSLTLNEPGGLCALDDALYIADTNNHCVKVVNVHDYSTTTLPVKMNAAPASAPPSRPSVAKAAVDLSSGGGVLDLHVYVRVPDGVKPLSESPAVWTLDLPEGWSVAQERDDRPGLSRHWTLSAPSCAVPAYPSAQLRPQCRLFYCHDNLCASRVLPFTVNVSLDANMPPHATCELDYLFTV